MTLPENNALFSGFPETPFPDVLTAAPETIAAAAAQRLRAHVLYAAERSPYYRRLFAELGVDAMTIDSPEALRALPFTDKNDLRAHGEAFFAAPPEAIVDVCLTSATTGAAPTLVPQTAGDLARLAYNEAVAFDTAGLGPSDTLLIAAALDRCFMAGMAYYLGAVRLGTRALRGGAGTPAGHWNLIKTCRATAIVGVPSFILKIAEAAKESGDDPARSSVKRILAIGEPVRDIALAPLPLTRKLETLWDAAVYSTYASTELATSFCECEARAGGHFRPELIVAEIVDANGAPVPDGQPGEVVVTPLGVTGMPLLRFKTNDIAFIVDAPCPCGRKTRRLGPILGRKNQMLKYKGATVFPNAILAALQDKAYFHDGYVEARTDAFGHDAIVARLALKTPVSIDTVRDDIRAAVRVAPEIDILPQEAIDRVVFQPDKKRKKVTFVDNRRSGGL